jgi:hypothetical protein
MATTLLQRNDIVRAEMGICDCVVLDVFADGAMATIAEITPAGKVTDTRGCAHSAASLVLIERPRPETGEEAR